MRKECQIRHEVMSRNRSESVHDRPVGDAQRHPEPGGNMSSVQFLPLFKETGCQLRSLLPFETDMEEDKLLKETFILRL